MKKGFLISLFFFLIVGLQATEGIFPFFFGARSLSMGAGGVAAVNGINPVFLNPALIGNFAGSISGYQFQSGYRDRDGFETLLGELLQYELGNFDALDTGQKEDVVGTIRELTRINTGFFGFSGHFPGAVLGNYGIGGALFTSGVINPVKTSRFDGPFSGISQEDIDSLAFEFHGFSFANYCLAYSLDITYDLRIAASFTYISGKYARREFTIANGQIFAPGRNRSDYLQEAWSEPEEELRSLNIDVAVNLSLGKYFRAGVVMRNVNRPQLIDSNEESVLDRVVVVGLAFKPDNSWQISADLQVVKGRMFLSDEEVQPLAIGLEKGFFNNMMFVRAGFMTDIDDQYLVGRKSNMLIGLGGGFHLGNFMVDIAAGIDHKGVLGGLAVSGFALLR